MIYEQCFRKTGGQSIRAGLIGTGSYGMSLFSQAQLIPRLEIPVLCDRNIEALRNACQQGGISEEQISLCKSRKAILQAIEDKKWAITQESDLLMDLPLDVIAECTGNPEAGARNAELAISHGYQARQGYPQKCKLCWEVRKFLRPYFPDTFGPAEIYENL